MTVTTSFFLTFRFYLISEKAVRIIDSMSNFTKLKKPTTIEELAKIIQKLSYETERLHISYNESCVSCTLNSPTPPLRVLTSNEKDCKLNVLNVNFMSIKVHGQGLLVLGGFYPMYFSNFIELGPNGNRFDFCKHMKYTLFPSPLLPKIN